VIAALALERPALSWMAIGAWLVTLGDLGGAYSSRAGAMLAMTIGGALVRLLGGVVGPHFGLAVLLMLVAGTGLSLLRVLGDAAAKVGGLLVILLAIALGARPEDLHAVAVEAGLVVAGGLVSTTLSLLFWGVHPYKPARFAVARSLEVLADATDDLRRLSRNEAEKELWDAWIRGAPRRVRAAIEAARGALFATRRGQASGSTLGDRLQVVVEQTDRIFEAMIGLGDQLEGRATRPEERVEDVDRPLADVTEELRRLAALTIDPDRPQRDAGRPEASTARAAIGADPPSRGRIRGALAVIFQSLETAAAALAILPGVAATSPHRDVDRVDAATSARNALMTLRAHLTPGSHAFRHAVRVGITTAVAMLVMTLIPITHGRWAVLAAAVSLQPSHAATWSRTVQRIAGTAAGAGLVALLTGLGLPPAAMIALIAFTIFAAVALMPLSYLYFAFFVTPAFVLFAELAERRQDLASARLLDTLIGGALALLGVSLFWRRADDQLLRRELAAAVERERVFLRCALARFTGTEEGSPTELAEARRQVGLANNNADDTLQQLLADGRDPRHEAFDVVLTYLRRIAARTISALAARAAPIDPAQRTALLAFGQRIDASLAASRASLERAAENVARRRTARDDEAADEAEAISVPAEGLPEPLRRIEVLVGEMRRRLLRGS